MIGVPVGDWEEPLPSVETGEHFYEVTARFAVYETRLVVARSPEQAAAKIDDYIGLVEGNFDGLISVEEVEQLPDYLETHTSE